MITKFEISDYGPIKNASGTLTPRHAFIGRHDSGKGFLLRALVTIVNRAAGKTPVYPVDTACSFSLLGNDATVRPSRPEGWIGVHPSKSPLKASVVDGARLVRFEADALRLPSALLPEEDALSFIDSRGAGLPAVYDVLNNRNDDAGGQRTEARRGLGRDSHRRGGDQRQ